MKLIKHQKAKSGLPVRLSPAPRAWSPLLPLRRLGEDIERLFEQPFSEWSAPTGGFFDGWGPPVDVYMDKDNVFVKVEIPGIKKDQIEVSMIGEQLSIRGERKEEAEHEGAECYRSERWFGRFHRSFSLPAAVEAGKIEAHYKDGVLTIVCPKTDEAKRRQIEIKVD
jgi:HSP20 family protein